MALDEREQELLAAAHLFLETMQSDKLAEEICRESARLMDCSYAHLYLVEGETFLLQEIGGFLGAPLEADDLTDNLLVEKGEIVAAGLDEALNGVLQDPGSASAHEALAALFPGQFVAAMPLRHELAHLGVLLLTDEDQGRRFSDDEEVLLRELAHFASQALSIEHVIGERESRDGLTGLYNQKYFKKAVAREIERVRRYGGEVSLVMVDIDHFKDVNDVHGHLVGDDVLKGVAGLISSGESVRLTDIASRYGGEEFAVLLVHTPLSGAIAYAENLREKVSSVTAWPQRTVTISCGVAELRRDSEDLYDITSNEFIRRADAALYQAKEQGRNRVVAHRS